MALCGGLAAALRLDWMDLQLSIFQMEPSPCPNRTCSFSDILRHLKTRNPVPLTSVSEKKQRVLDLEKFAQGVRACSLELESLAGWAGAPAYKVSVFSGMRRGC